MTHDSTLLRGAGAPRGPSRARLTNHGTLLRGAGAPRGPSGAQLTNHDTLLRGVGALRGPCSNTPTYYDLPPLTTGPEGPSSTRPRQTQGVDGWGSIPVVFFPDPAGHPYRTPACKTPFPPSAAAYWKGVISVHPLWVQEPGGQEDNSQVVVVVVVLVVVGVVVVGVAVIIVK